MKGFKSHFVFNRSERNGIFLLVLLIVLAQLAYFFISLPKEDPVAPAHLEEVLFFQAQVDSLKKVAVAEDTLRLFPFNPNFISDYKGYVLGMSVEEIDRLHAFRAQDKWVNSVDDFQEITGVSDSLLEIISVSFRFPEWVERAPAGEKGSRRAAAESFSIQDLNKAREEELRKISGIGEVLSRRIVKYRESIGGFVHEKQLHNVYGLDSLVVERTLKRFRVLETSELPRQDLNSISLSALTEIPGLDYELARAIVKFRESGDGIKSFDELLQIKDFSRDKIEIFKLYLTINKELENID